jgi:hypothetical protein
VLPLRHSPAPRVSLEASRPRERLRPTKLFEKSSVAFSVQLLASAENRRISFGYHRIYIDGTRGTAVKHSGALHTCSGEPRIDRQALPEVIDLSGWYYHSNTLVNVADSYIHEQCRELKVPGRIWTGTCVNAVHHSQRLAVKPLKSSDWPSDPLGPSWPSFPSIVEWMEMLRRGLDPFSRDCYSNPAWNLGFTQVSRLQVRENPALASRIVSNNIVGIRSSVEVPRKFLKYFRYSQNFLILVAAYKMPIGLVRFLIAQWCVAPYSLWLRRAVSFKIFLKKVPSLHVKRANDWLTTRELSRAAIAGSCTPPADLDTDLESVASSELD